MLAAIMLLIASGLLATGGALCGFAKSGPQETLGGVIIMVGIIAGMIAGLCWWAGL
jgi:hypothetical protein